MSAPSRLEILKALGENTRYAIYLELARSPRPLATAEIAATLDLHANTVRPHLERMREVGLLEQRVANDGGVGRPQHLYSLAPDAPSLGLEPPAMPALARMLLTVAAEAGLDGNDAEAAGREEGARDAVVFGEGSACIEALMTQLEYLGFDPEVTGGPDGVTIAFTHCPFRELAEANPDLVCGLHRGMVSGFVDALGTGEMGAFRTLVDRVPCQTDVVEIDLDRFDLKDRQEDRA